MATLNGPKIVMTGGGSYNWGPRLLCDIIQTDELQNSEIILLDPNLKAAKDLQRMAVQVAAKLGRKFKIIATDDENTAYKDASFVLITISTGDLEMMKHDLAIPEKFGIYHTVGDSVGPGGWSRTLRNVPVFVRMAQKIEKLSPRAVILNYTNPMATLTGTIAKSSSLRVVGLCHGLFETYGIIKKIFGVEEKDISLLSGGVNHFFWVTDFKIKGENGYALLKKKIGRKSIDDLLPSATDAAGFVHTRHMLCNELYHEYGLLTYSGDRHTCEFFTPFITDLSLMERFQLKRTSIEDRYNNREKSKQRVNDLTSGKLEPYKKSRETAVDIMKSFVTNVPFVDVVNLPNEGQIDNLSRGAVVETLGFVSAGGFRPISVGRLPEKIRAIVEPHCIVQNMTLEAAMTGNKKLAMDSLMIDPLCAKLPPSAIRKMGNALMEATKDWLPQFK